MASKASRARDLTAFRQETTRALVGVYLGSTLIATAALTAVFAPLGRWELLLGLWAWVLVVLCVWRIRRAGPWPQVGVLAGAPLLVSILALLSDAFTYLDMSMAFGALVASTLAGGRRLGYAATGVLLATILAHIAGVRLEGLHDLVVATADGRTRQLAELLATLPNIAVVVFGLSLFLGRLDGLTAEMDRQVVELDVALGELEARGAELRLSEEHLRKVFEGVPDGITIVRLSDQLVLDLNPGFERLSGWSRAECRGRRLVDLGFVGADADLEGFGVALRAAGGPIMLETKVRTRAGLERDVECTNVIVEWDGELAVLTIGRDVTEERRLDDKLRARQRLELVGTLAAGVSHNFNNALGAVIPNLELALDDAPLSLCEPLRDALQAARHAAELSTRLQLVVRGDAGSSLSTVDVRAVVEDVVKLCQETVGRRVVIEARLEGGPSLLRAHKSHLEQVFINLCMNARDAMKDAPSPRLSVTLREREGPVPETGRGERHVVVSVADNGTGITPDVLEHLGEPFFTTKGLAVGTGLGLPTAFGIVRELGGQIACETAVGVGTTFTVSLPIDPALHPATPTAPHVEAAQGRGRVLVIDDEPLVLRAIGRMLEHMGFVAVRAEGAAAGLAALASGGDGFHAILLDLDMPERSGEDALPELRAAAPGVPIVLITGDAARGEGQAVDAVLGKPIDVKALTRLLDSIVAP